MLKSELKKLLRDPLPLIAVFLMLVLTVICAFVIPAENIEVNTQGTYDSATLRAVDNIHRLLAGHADKDSFYDSYEEKSQAQMLAVYEGVKDVDISEDADGHTTALFSDGYAVIFLLVAIVFLCGRIFLSEYEDGALYLVRATYRGRYSIMVYKWLSAFLVSALLTVTFQGSVMVVQMMRVGIPSFGASMQSLSAFTFCPFRVNVCGAYAWMVLQRIVTVFAFGVTAGTLCMLFKNAVCGYVGGVALLGVQLFSDTLKLTGANRYPLLVNFISAAECREMFERYHGMQVFASSVSYPILICILLAIICLFAFLIQMYLYRRSEGKGRMGIMPFVGRKKEKKRIKASSVIGCEYKRLIIHEFIPILLILLIVGKVIYNRSTLEPILPDEQLYQRYIGYAEGSVTEKTDEVISEQRREIRDTEEEYYAIQEGYRKGAYTEREYRDARSKYEATKAKERAVSRVESRCDDIKEILSGGEDAWLIYESGWERIFDLPFDSVLYLFLLLLSARSFSYDYETGVAVLLRSSGTYPRVVRKRVTAIFTVAAVAAVLSFASDVCVLYEYYVCNYPEAPLRSLPSFFDVPFEISIGGALMLMLVVKVFAAQLYCGIVCFVSAKSKRTVAALLCGVLMIVVCYLMV